MAKVSYVDLLCNFEPNPLKRKPITAEQYFATIKPSDCFEYSRIVMKSRLTSEANRSGVHAHSLLPAIAALWNALSVADKAAWTAAGVECNLNGYRTFVKDTSLRMRALLPGVAVPSLLHQAKVGALSIEAPANELKITQIHPHNYWIYRKKIGLPPVYQPVLVTEDIGLDFKIKLNYRAELVADGADPYAQFFVRFWHSYQGVDHSSDYIINLDLDTTAIGVDGWTTADATISLLGVGPFGDTDFAAESELLGYYFRYDLYLHLHDVTGMLYTDNIKVIHHSTNWVRDIFCNDINQGFTKQFYQIPKHWTGVVVPAGSSFESVYKDFT